MKRNIWIVPIGGLVLLFVFNVAASPGGCGGSEPKQPSTASQTTQEEPPAPTTQTTVVDATKTEQPPAVKPPDTTTKPPEPPTIAPTSARITLNVRNATLEPLPGAPPRFAFDDLNIFESPPRLQTTTPSITGQSALSQLKSLKVYPLRITICNEQGVLLSGSGGQIVNEGMNCFKLYKDPEFGVKPVTYWENYNGDQAKADAAKFVDFMDAKDLAARLQNIPIELPGGAVAKSPWLQEGTGFCNNNGVCDVDKGEYPRICPADCPKEGTETGGEGTRSGEDASASPAKAYVYGVVEAVKLIKVNGELTLNDGRTLISKDVLPTLDSGSGISAVYTVRPESLEGAAGSSQEMVVAGSVGGFFKFQAPFTITQADLDSKTQFTLDLIFNPDGLLYGVSKPPFTAAQVLDKSGNSMIVSSLRVEPAPRKSTDAVVRETYLLTLPKFNVRLDLYSLKGDPAKVIYSVDLRIINTKSTDTVVAQSNAQIFFIGSEPDGKLSFQQYAKVALVSNFTRFSTEGQSGTAKVLCTDEGGSGVVGGSGWNLSGIAGTLAPGCASATSTLDSSYKLESVKEVK